MDLLESATRSFDQISGMFLKDLDALPQDAFTRHFGGKARTVADIVFEVNDVNDYFGASLRGEKTPEWDMDRGWLRAPEDFNKKEDVIAAFKASTSRLKDTIASFTSEQLDTPIPGEPNGRTYYSRIMFLGMHMMYHSGQLNFAQTILGDDEWHW